MTRGFCVTSSAGRLRRRRTLSHSPPPKLTRERSTSIQRVADAKSSGVEGTMSSFSLRGWGVHIIARCARGRGACSCTAVRGTIAPCAPRTPSSTRKQACGTGSPQHGQLGVLRKVPQELDQQLAAAAGRDRRHRRHLAGRAWGRTQEIDERSAVRGAQRRRAARGWPAGPRRQQRTLIDSLAASVAPPPPPPIVYVADSPAAISKCSVAGPRE